MLTADCRLLKAGGWKVSQFRIHSAVSSLQSAVVL